MNIQENIPQKITHLTFDTQSLIIDGDLNINLKIKSPQVPAARPGISIICVLDISGSMDTQATQGVGVQSDGFTRLDLVKHSVNTIINSMHENDALGIVTFSDNARIDLDMLQMTEQNRTKALEIISKMRTQGSTNLWDGIRLGLQLSKHHKCKQRNTFVVVLSDGEPNQRPENGQLYATAQYIKNNPLTASMSMFGYGYSLDTKLLAGLTQIGGGCFGYIPDCSMIGTIFVNFLSTAYSSFSPKLQASLQLKNNVEIKQFNGNKSNVTNLGTVQYGVDRSCLIRFNGVPQYQQLAQINIYFVQNSRQKITIKLTNQITEQNQKHTQSIKIQKIKNQHINLLEHCLANADSYLILCAQKAKQHLNKMKQLKKQLLNQNIYLDALIRDIQSQNKQQGQVLIALSNAQYWQKWGRHYFAALKIAHVNQMCTNFKDPGLQLYGGQQFKNQQSRIDTIFISLPPPIPSIQKYDQNGNLKVVADMSNYYDEQGGCIHGECQVIMFDGTSKKVKDLKKGDKLLNESIIKCIIKTQVNKIIQMVRFDSGLIITKYHPVYIANTWHFPIQLTKLSNSNSSPKLIKIHTQAYYNFILESPKNNPSILINNIPCITLAHGILNDQVAEHEYFGTQKIVRDLQQFVGWSSGEVVLKGDSFVRDGRSKIVIGIKKEQTAISMEQ